MKITINESREVDETEIIIHCQQVDEQILRISASLRAYDQKVTGVKDSQTFLLNASQLLYIETVDRKTFLYTDDGVYETPLRLYEFEERFPREDFIRVSKSCILNFDKVKSLRGDFGGKLLCTLENHENISVSRQYAIVIKKKLQSMKGKTS